MSSSEELALSVAPIVKRIAWKYADVTAIEREDLEGEGWTGVMTAVKSFDPTRGVPFAAYARPYIMSAVLDALTSQSRTIRITADAYVDASTVMKASTAFMETEHRQPSVADIAEATGMTVARVKQTLATIDMQPKSLDRPVAASPDAEPLGWTVAETRPDVQPEHVHMLTSMQDTVSGLLSTFPPDTAGLAARLYGVDAAGVESARQTRVETGLTVTELARVQADVVARVTHPRNAFLLREWVD